MSRLIWRILPHRHDWLEIDPPPHCGDYEFNMCRKCGVIDAC